MESAPQSTITHNAVIEFASDPDGHPTPSPRERRAHKNKARPAQKGGLKSGGTMPKSFLGRNVAKAINHQFQQVFAFKRADSGSAGSWAAGDARFGSPMDSAVDSARTTAA